MKPIICSNPTCQADQIVFGLGSNTVVCTVCATVQVDLTGYPTLSHRLGKLFTMPSYADNAQFWRETALSLTEYLDSKEQNPLLQSTVNPDTLQVDPYNYGQATVQGKLVWDADRFKQEPYKGGTESPEAYIERAKNQPAKTDQNVPEGYTSWAEYEYETTRAQPAPRPDLEEKNTLPQSQLNDSVRKSVRKLKKEEQDGSANS